MPFQISPGINVSEKDATTIATGVSTTRAGFAGVFRWGPAEQRVNISSETDLVRIFGKPTDMNGETWFTAANFLAYGNSLDVVRVVDANTFSAYANTGAVSTAPAIKNMDDFNDTTIDANVAYVAKYPGEAGNSLRISVCDSPTQYQSNLTADAAATSATIVFVPGSNTATLTIAAANTAAANTSANTFASKLTVGDQVIAGSLETGIQKLKVSAVGAPSANGNSATVTLNFTQPFTMAANYSANVANGSAGIRRTWEFADLVDRAPTTSKYLQDLNLTTVDQLHVVVTDEDGVFTGSPGTVLEVWTELSRATDAKTENQQTQYYKTVLNNGSQYIWAGADRAGAASATAAALANSTATVPYTASFVAGADGVTENNVSLGKLVAGYDKFKLGDTDADVSILLQGKARGLSADSNITPSSASVNYSTLANYILSNIAEYRKDMVVCVSPAYADVVPTNIDRVAAVLAYKNNINLATSYGIMESGYKYQYDKYNDKFRWVPLNGDVGGTLVRTDFDRDPWYSPAGADRGTIKNCVKLAWNPNKSERDDLYKEGVNPVITRNGLGTILHGDKTLIGRTSAFDRINVRRLFIILEKAIATAAEFALFEFNDHFTRNRFVSIVEPFLRDVQGRRGIYDFKVVCDETNNTPQVIDSNGFVGDIYIKPARSINFIQLNFTAVGTGVEFNEIVGQI